MKITHLMQWNEAFSVFSAIKQIREPQIAGELLRYGHTIAYAAKNYGFCRAYEYDMMFRKLKADEPEKFKWGEGNDEIWRTEMGRKIEVAGIPKGKGSPADRKKKGGFCRRYNKNGRCTFGAECYFPHSCSYCGKPGHGAFECKKKAPEKKDPKPVETTNNI